MNNDAIIYSKQQILVGPINKHASIFKTGFSSVARTWFNYQYQFL